MELREEAEGYPARRAEAAAGAGEPALGRKKGGTPQAAEAKAIDGYGPSEKLDYLLGYLEENWDGIYGSRNLESKVGAKEVLVVGSGGVEKNIDLILYSRFKGRGISWSLAGAQNLLKLKLFRYNSKDWKVNCEIRGYQFVREQKYL